MSKRKPPGEDPMERMRRKHQELMEKYGWYAHYVPGDTSSPTEFNAHTHGFMDSWKHPDVQIVVPMPQEVAHGIFIRMAELVKNGDKFEPGQEYSGILENMNVQFAPAQEGGREVLRIILPDKQGRTDPSMAEPYSIQWKGTKSWN